jgi:cytochrome b561
MLVLTFSGYLISTADGKAIDVFEVISIPALPFAFDNQEDIAGDLHEICAWLLVVIVSLHAFAALKHHIVDRDKTLLRIIKPQRRNHE